MGPLNLPKGSGKPNKAQLRPKRKRCLERRGGSDFNFSQSGKGRGRMGKGKDSRTTIPVI